MPATAIQVFTNVVASADREFESGGRNLLVSVEISGSPSTGGRVEVKWNRAPGATATAVAAPYTTAVDNLGAGYKTTNQTASYSFVVFAPPPHLVLSLTRVDGTFNVYVQPF